MKRNTGLACGCFVMALLSGCDGSDSGTSTEAVIETATDTAVETIIEASILRLDPRLDALIPTDAEVENAAEAASIHDEVIALPDGYDTLIGERGDRLSGGQRQRITIARAILKNAPILLLDEATASLDSESEQRVQLALEELMKDRTVLVVAHRLSTVRNVDRVLVLEHGRIVEQGTDDSLRTSGGLYSRLSALQEMGLAEGGHSGRPDSATPVRPIE